MFFSVISLTTTTPTTSSGILGMVLPLALMFGLLYLLMIRPQKKKEKELRAQIDSMKVGDNCVSIGGILGRVVNIKDNEVTIQTSVANTLITVRKSAISQVVKPVSEDD